MNAKNHLIIAPPPDKIYGVNLTPPTKTLPVFVWALLASVLLHACPIFFGLLTPHFSFGTANAPHADQQTWRLEARLTKQTKQNASDAPMTGNSLTTSSASLAPASANAELALASAASAANAAANAAENAAANAAENAAEETSSANHSSSQNSPPAATVYASGSELSAAPHVLIEPFFDLPQPISGADMPTGKLLIDVAVSALGLVDWVSIQESDLPPVYNDSIAASFKAARYQAGEIDGKKVASLVRIEVSVGENNTSALIQRLLSKEPATEALISKPKP